jgi:protoporphyrin/coproporphyrin ferrochelatase
MPQYFGLSQHSHDSPQRLGVLLVNLGTPDGPDPASVRRFLAEFLWDPRVIETPRWLWWLILHGVILRIRPSKSAHAYQQIWTRQGSPLMVYSRALAERVQEGLRHRQLDIGVGLGMSYGSPSIPDTLQAMYRDGVRKVLVLPLYPQYSATTTASVFDRVTRTLQTYRWVPEMRFVTEYHDAPRYVDAIAQSIRDHWQTHPRHHLLFSFHGVPRSYLLAGDPYYCHCMKTARLVSTALGLTESEWSVSFQSQVGRAEWLRPYTDELLVQYAQGDRKSVTVICPGFATDCLETLEEIALRNRSLFLSNGGTAYDYIPALNAQPEHAELLIDLILRHTQGWMDEAGTTDAPLTRERAMQAGAQR